MKIFITGFIGLFLTILLVLLRNVISNLFINTWMLLTEDNYIIPIESSISEFRSTILNDGSANWWIYGEDKNNYYHFVGSDSVSYYISTKVSTAECAGFNSIDYSTWCESKPILKVYN